LEDSSFDVIVIGAGAGGLFAAARLASRGYRTVVVENLDKVGGRASTDEIDGFKVNVGAIVIEVGGITEQTCLEVGAPFDIREPKPPLLYRIKGRDVDVTGGGWGMLLGKLSRQGAKLVTGIGAARQDSGLPDAELSTAEWVSKYTKNESVHGIFRNMCASIFAVGSEDLPARVFLTYFTRKSAFKRFGFHPEGTIGLWRALAAAIERHGGTVWCSTPATRIRTDRNGVTGVEVSRDGAPRILHAPVVISDIGPAATLSLLDGPVPEDYVELVKRGDRPTAMISVNFASREPLIAAQGMLSFAKSRRLAYIANFTGTCPEMAPAGWNLYVGTAVPKPSVGPFDELAEAELLMADLRDVIPGFDERARVINVATTRDGWPPQRAVAGFDLPHTTPITGLWNVGDAVKQYANGGTTACAETAALVVEEIVAAFPLQENK
jgi:phytoene desaturase